MQRLRLAFPGRHLLVDIDDGRLPEHTEGSVGVRESLALLERNISRNHPRPELAALLA
ncbi:hypothetical protein [Actinomadura coerulea]|uniref:hypothetical protein n=1 Tax=Actinomadura coerulea TaxID=46159 RepID=UPI003418C681